MANKYCNSKYVCSHLALVLNEDLAELTGIKDYKVRDPEKKCNSEKYCVCQQEEMIHA